MFPAGKKTEQKAWYFKILFDFLVQSALLGWFRELLFAKALTLITLLSPFPCLLSNELIEIN